jgi:hypothetical protein
VSEGGAAVVDPADPHAFWTFQDFGAGDGAYGVQITRVRVVPEPGTALLLACGLTRLVAARQQGSGSGIRRS